MKACEYVDTFVSVSKTARDVWVCLRDFVLPDLDQELTPEQADLLLRIHRDETVFAMIQEKVGEVIGGEGLRVGEIVERITRTQTLASYHLKNLWKRGWIALLPAEGGAPITSDSPSAGRRKARGFRLRDRVSITRDDRRRKQLDQVYGCYNAFADYVLQGCDPKDLEAHRRVNRFLITEFGGGGTGYAGSPARASAGDADSPGFASPEAGTLMTLQQASSDLERKAARRALEGSGLSMMEADLLIWLRAAQLTGEAHANDRRLLNPDERGFVTLWRLVNASLHLPKRDPVLVTRLLTRMMSKNASLVEVKDNKGVPKTNRFSMDDRLCVTQAGGAKAEMVRKSYAEGAERVLTLYVTMQAGGKSDLEAHLRVNNHIRWLLRPAFLQLDAGKNFFIVEDKVEPSARLNCLEQVKV
jgi:hypothetical protein